MARCTISQTRRRALLWTGGYAAALVGFTSLLPVWACHRPSYKGSSHWYVDDISFWEAAGNAVCERDPRYLWVGEDDPRFLWGGDNRLPTLTLLTLAALAWPVAFGLSMWCRRPRGPQAADYGDGRPGP